MFLLRSENKVYFFTQSCFKIALIIGLIMGALMSVSEVRKRKKTIELAEMRGLSLKREYGRGELRGVLSIFLSVVLCVSLMPIIQPVTAYADVAEGSPFLSVEAEGEDNQQGVSTLDGEQSSDENISELDAVDSRESEGVFSAEENDLSPDSGSSDGEALDRFEIWYAGVDDSSLAGELYPMYGGSSVSARASTLRPMTFGEEILYFCKYESSQNYDQGLSAGDGYHAMGYFQFDNRYGLGNFLKAVYSYNSSTYSCLKVIGDKYGWDTNRETRKNGAFTAFGNDLNAAWHAAYAANPTEFSQLQNGWAYSEYYDASDGVRKALKAMGINIDNRPDCIKGLVWGMTNLFGKGGGASYIDQGLYYGANWFYKNSGISNGMSNERFVTTLCNYVVNNVAKRYPSQSQYWKGWQNRYKNELSDCLKYLAAEDKTLDIPGIYANVKCQIVSAANEDLVLTVADGASSGANITANKNTDSAEQYWYISGVGNELACVSSFANRSSVLDANGVSPVSGSNVTVWTSNGGLNQSWSIAPADTSGEYTLKLALNSDLVLDAEKATPVDGANVSVYTSNGGANQKWKVRYSVEGASVSVSGMERNATGDPLAPTIGVTMLGKTLEEGKDYVVLYNGSLSAPTESGSYEISIEGKGSFTGTNAVGTMVVHDSLNVDASVPQRVRNAANSLLVLDAAKEEPVSGANVTVYNSNDGANQAWLFELNPDGYYTIRNAANNSLVLDAAKEIPSSGANVSAYLENGGLNQKWIAVKQGNAYMFKNAANNSLVLDASKAIPASGANVSAYSSNGGANQEWTLAIA